MGITSSGNMTLQSTGGQIVLQSAFNNNLLLRSGTGTGRIYIRSGLTGYTSDQLLRVSTSGGALPSTRIIKKDIKEIPNEQIIEIFDKINILEYKDKFTNEKKYSLIIEDELEKQNDLFKSIIKREEKSFRFEKEEDIPDFLKEYIGTEHITKEEDAYYFNPLVYDATSL
jgi:hypothetical protein